ncbi:AaceriAER444Wp [[Ashbya] aceris (nom. inval.)]|nr:AaceriAER444Wp [[Ashbya] aceris (nom. inval.)]
MVSTRKEVAEVVEKEELNSTKEVNDSWSDSEVQSAHGDNPFADPSVADYYRKVYDDAKYECRHAFDPKLSWTKEEERRIVRKIDIHVALAACLLFAAFQIDVGNLGQAVGDNMLDDLNMDTNQYNLGNQLFSVIVLLAEIPVQLLSKRIGLDIVIPSQIVCWSIVAMSQAAMKNYAGFYVTRMFIGLCEGGFMSNLTLWLSFFYTSRELAVRLSLFYATMSTAHMMTSLGAFGIFRMRGVCNLAGWQWMFLLEGLITLCIGMFGFMLVVPSIVQTKNKFYRKGWFSQREMHIAVNRVLRDDPSKGDMHNRQGLSLGAFLKVLRDYDLWPVYLIGLIQYLPEATVTPYLLLTLRNVGFSRLNVQLMALPNSASFSLGVLAITKFAQIVDERALVGLIPCVWKAVLLGMLRWWPGSFVDAWGTYAIMVTLLAAPFTNPICVGWVSKNANSIKTRTVACATFQVFYRTGIIAANQFYRKDDAPLYHRGNSILFWIIIANIPVMILTKLYYIWRNKSRDKIWDAMSEEERRDYIHTTTDSGNKRLDFRFAH